MSKFSPQVPDSMSLADALRGSAPLARLRERLDRCERCFEAVRPLLPGVLALHVRPGPVDESGWTLLAANAAVAAKLRQLQPRLEEALRARGWEPSTVRIKVQSPG